MKRYALVVGINRYDDPEIGNLNYAADDAREVGSCLRDLCGFDDVRTLVSGGEREPDHIAVVEALHAFAPLLNKDDLFLFYFAGHGIHTANGSFLLASNSRIRMPELAAVPMPLLQQCLSRLDAAERVLILDACRNDPHQGRGDADNLLTQEFSRDILAVAQTPCDGIAPATCVLFSCSEGERAYEWPDKGHGAFTWYLLEGMRGAARDPQGRLTIQDLSRYVEERVTHWSRKMTKARLQTPWAQQVGSLRTINLAAGVKPAVSAPYPAPKTDAVGTASNRQTEELRRDIQFDVEECERAARTGQGPENYIEKAAQARISDWQRGAELAWPEAQWLVGRCTELGIGVAKDEVEAVRWFRKAAEQGNSRGQVNLGVCYKNGIGVVKDEAEAVRWYRKAAEQGHAKGQFALGACYATGTGVAKDEAEAVRWYRKAAEQGHAKSQFTLGVYYDSGTGVAEDEAEAVRWYRKAAEQGYAKGQFNLGVCYDTGTGVTKDKAEAVRWYRKAAEQGHAKGQFTLGVCYRNGFGVTKNAAEAVRWFRKAAEQGYAFGQNNLGVCYEFGTGVAKDEAEAVRWYRKAAEQGHAKGQFNLGVCYRNGSGVTKNTDEAMRWFRKAAEQGDEDSVKALKELERTKEGSKEGCFISTAVAQALKLGDDATELNRLRTFRDTWMQTTPELRAEVAEYYRIAPGIVRQIDMSGEAGATYRSLCDDFILPALAALDRNEPVEAHRLYRAMVETLAARFPAEKRHGTIMNDRKRGSR